MEGGGTDMANKIDIHVTNDLIKPFGTQIK
jgi:hypothetical protein